MKGKAKRGRKGCGRAFFLLLSCGKGKRKGKKKDVPPLVTSPWRLAPAAVVWKKAEGGGRGARPSGSLTLSRRGKERKRRKRRSLRPSAIPSSHDNAQ